MSSTADPQSESTSPHGRLTPPVWFWALAVFVVVLNVVTHTTEIVEHAIALVVLAATSFIVLMALLVWLAIDSGYSPAVRRTPLIVVLVAIGIFAALFRIERFSGELWPQLALRWQKHPDQMLPPASPTAAPDGVALDKTTDHDFPQFLGPKRSAAVDDLQLALDWTTPPKKLWSISIGAGHSAFAIVNGFGVTMEQRGPDELVTCYDILTGQLKWSSGVETRHTSALGGIGPRSTPTIDEGRVYAVGATGALRCLDGRDGKVIWSKDLLQEIGSTPAEDAAALSWGRSGSPLIVDDLVIVPGGGPTAGPWISLLAYDKRTGEKRWQAGTHQIGYSSPALAVLGGVRQVLIVNEDNISAHDPVTGQLYWQHDWPGHSTSAANASQVVPVGGDRCFVSKGYTGGCQLFAVSHDEKTGWSTQMLWHQSRDLMTKFTNVVVYQGFIYGLSDGILECVDLESGKRRWKQGRYGQGQILRVGELLLVSTEQGGIVLVEPSPEGLHELGQFQAIEGQTWNNPALFGRYLVVRNSEQAACYELPLANGRATAK